MGQRAKGMRRVSIVRRLPFSKEGGRSVCGEELGNGSEPWKAEAWALLVFRPTVSVVTPFGLQARKVVRLSRASSQLRNRNPILVNSRLPRLVEFWGQTSRTSFRSLARWIVQISEFRGWIFRQIMLPEYISLYSLS